MSTLCALSGPARLLDDTEITASALLIHRKVPNNAFAPRAFRNTLYALTPVLNGFMSFRADPKMKIKLPAALLLFLIASSCSNSKIESGLGAELQPRNEPVKIGEMAPNFTLEDQNGQKVTLSALRGGAPTVLAFYRGN